MCTVLSRLFPIMTEKWSDSAAIAYIPWVLSTFNIMGTIEPQFPAASRVSMGQNTKQLLVLAVRLGQIGCALSNNICLMIFFSAVLGVGMAVSTLFDSVAGVAFYASTSP